VNEITIAQAGTRALEAYIAAGDIGRLGPDQRIALYRAVCDSLGLNPLTQPFQYLTLSGKTVLYATKSCTEQLRQIHGVSVTRMEREIVGDILTVTVSVRERTGREDISTGSVSLAGLKGENLSNAHMKAETKAKRRATLSICGLAVLDETEVDSIPGAQAVAVEEFHAPAKAEPKKAARPTREERRRDLEDLTSPIPQAERVEAPAPVPATDPASGSAPSSHADSRRLTQTHADSRRLTQTHAESLGDERIIRSASPIGVVEAKGGRRVWRIDQESEIFAILDERIASIMEAQQAFQVDTRVRCRARANGTLEIVEVVGDVR
jgi:hypothetical protein